MVDFADLDDALAGAQAKGLTNEQKRERASIVNGGETTYEQIRCPKCNGVGSRTYGYVNIRTYPCTMCKQTGKVTARRIASVEAAKRGRETAAANLQQRINEFATVNKLMYDFIVSGSSWSDFYRSMYESIQTYGRLTDGQFAAVQRGMEKSAERAHAKSEAQAAKGGEVDVSAIEALFAVAKSNGLKRLKFRTARIDISVAKETSRNAGSLYIVDNGEYVGKITSGRFLATNAAKADVLSELQKIAADPSGVARLYGKQTGICCCCGKELTDPDSIANGIGPICARKWGI